MAVSASADTASSLWYCGQGKVEIRQEILTPPGAGEVRVKTLYSAISRGTESLVFGGRIPESEFERMRAPFMAGDFPFPVKYGYAAVGRVEDGGGALRGKNVFALYPHQTAFNIPAARWSRFRRTCRHIARCWRPTWRPRSTACGTLRQDRPTASPSSGPAWSVPSSPICAGGCLVPRLLSSTSTRPRGISRCTWGWFR